MQTNSQTLSEKYNLGGKGGHYRFLGDLEENIFMPGDLEFDASGNARIRVWYPVTNIKTTIPFDSRLRETEYVHVTEIDPIRERYDKAHPAAAESRVLDLRLEFQKSREAQERKERKGHFETISHLADHIPTS